MAEYYPLLAKAIGSLPNSTLESRRVVYERARKALIGQLRTLHPPVPDEDIERESVALDRAVERVESELASGVLPGASPPVAKVPDAASAPTPSATPAALPPAITPKAGGAIGPAGQRPVPPLRPPTPRPAMPKPSSPRPPAKPPIATPPAEPAPADEAANLPPPAPRPPPLRPPVGKNLTPKPPTSEPSVPDSPVVGEPPASVDAISPEAPAHAPSLTAPSTTATPPPSNDGKRLKPPQRPIAPQAQGAAGPKRRLWIIPVVVGVVALLVAGAAWKLRDRPESLAKNKPAEQTETGSGKTATRVGEPANSPAPTESESQPTQPEKAPAETSNAAPQTAPATNPNPEVPVAHRAALLVEAPDEPNKVKTFLGTVVWKLNNSAQGAADAVGLAVEADIDLPDDKMKAVVTFEKNTDASLPASHTIKVRLMVEPGSFSGNVKQISVPMMRAEADPNGEPLAGVTVPITTNSFLVGLSPGNAEAANTDLIRRLKWVDIPMMLDSGKVAKLTFEKGDSGERDLNEALEAWSKQ